MNGRRETSEYLDGRLRARDRERFEARLSNDPALAAEVEETRRALVLARSLPLEVAPPDLLAGVMAQVRQQPVPARRWIGWEVLSNCLQPARLAVATAAVAVVVGAGLLSMQNTRPPMLDQTDQAFVSECERDYHFEAHRQLTRHSAMPNDALPPEF